MQDSCDPRFAVSARRMGHPDFVSCEWRAEGEERWRRWRCGGPVDEGGGVEDGVVEAVRPVWWKRKLWWMRMPGMMAMAIWT